MVSVLLTCDIHTHVTGSEPVHRDLVETRRLLNVLGLRCTFFFPAHSAELLRDHVDGLREEGHEIGCHGLTHDPSENYGRLPLAKQRVFLTEATARLTKILGEPPVSFRAPVFKISPETIRVLDELNYRADLSVTAQRLGVFGSDIYDMKPLLAARRPYHPSLQSPFRRGTARIWEIPVSAWLLPFLSNTERLCGLAFMRWFFRALHLEAKMTGKPIVFMFHAEDLNGLRGVETSWRLSWKDFLPTRTFGFQFRHALLERDWRRVQQDLMGLFRFMAGFPDVQVLTANEYLSLLERTPLSQPRVAQKAAVAVQPAAATSAPMMGKLAGNDILCVSSIDWDFIWQGHQQIMETFAQQGSRVLFIENTGVRAPTLRDFPRLKHRILSWLRSTKGFRRERENLFVYSPLILPFPYSALARWINRRLLLRALQRWMRVMAFHRPILWTFLPTPLTLDLIRELDPELTVYYCIDNLSSSSPAARRISRSESQLFRQADLVFVTSQKLRERASGYTDQVHLFPFGVDFEQYEAVRQGADGIPADLQSLPRPVVGYVGGLHRWIDQELLAVVAERMPEITFALIGPPQTDLSRLARYPNIRLLGAKPHHALPHYTKGFDVGIVPYRLSDYTAHVYPTKLNEYLAMGIPVIATDLPEIRRFNAAHGDVVAVARNPDEFVSAIHAALADHAPHAVTRRINVARENSWMSRIAKMSALIEGKLLIQQPAGERWQEALRRLYRRARSRAFRLVVGIAVGYLVLFKSPLLWVVAEPLRMAEPARYADAIVVFAGGVGESGKAGGGYQERVKQAADLYQQGLAPRVIFASGYTFVFQEAEIMKDLAVSLGIPASAILLEKQASTTYENVTGVAALLERSGWHSILLVSSPYHMRRAVMTWRKAAPQIRVIPTPSESQFYDHDVGASLEQLRGILHEYLGLGYYRWKGWL